MYERHQAEERIQAARERVIEAALWLRTCLRAEYTSGEANINTPLAIAAITTQVDDLDARLADFERLDAQAKGEGGK